MPKTPKVKDARPKKRIDANKKQAHKREKCDAPRKSDGRPCKKDAGWGTDHVGYGPCKLHGGTLKSIKKSIAKEIATNALITYGVKVPIDPAQGLLEEIARTHGHILWLESVIQGLSQEELVFGVHSVEGPAPVVLGNYHNRPTDDQKLKWVKQNAAPNIWLQLYQHERKHFTDVCRIAIACGIAERQTAFAEKQGVMIAEVIRGVIEDLKIDMTSDSAKKRVNAIVRKHLTLASIIAQKQLTA